MLCHSLDIYMVSPQSETCKRTETIQENTDNYKHMSSGIQLECSSSTLS